MNAEEAIRFVAHQASLCREHETHEALCLLLPGLLRVLELEPMTGFEAEVFRRKFKGHLDALPLPYFK